MKRLLFCLFLVVTSSAAILTSSCGPTDDIQTPSTFVGDAPHSATKHQAAFAVDGSPVTCGATVVSGIATTIPGSGVQTQPVTIAVAGDAPAPLMKAVEDLQEDLYNLFGRPANLEPVITSAPNAAYNSIIVT